MNPDVPCRVSADELKHDRDSEKLPYWTCQRCQEELFEEDASAQNWLVCAGCGRALCEECVIFIAETAEESQRYGPAAHTYMENDERFTRLGSVHNLGFCSPGCLAMSYEMARKELRAWTVEASRSGLAWLMNKVHAVCNLERK